MPEKLNLWQKILAVQAEAEIVPKKGRNEFHGYDYAMEADYISVLRPLCIKHGLVLTATCIESHAEKGWARVVVQLRVIDADTGEKIEVNMPGYSEDGKGDKAIFKALTGANKYALGKGFNLPTGNDPEGHEAPLKGQPRAKSVDAKAWAKKDKTPGMCKTCGATAVRTYGLSKRGKEFNLLKCDADPTHEEWLPINPNEMLLPF